MSHEGHRFARKDRALFSATDDGKWDTISFNRPSREVSSQEEVILLSLMKSFIIMERQEGKWRG